MRAVATAATHRGLVREENQDCVLVGEWLCQAPMALRSTEHDIGAAPVLFAVLDGMGGHHGGALASLVGAQRLARQTVEATQLGSFASAGEAESLVQALVEAADAGVREHATGEYAEMGATLAGAVVSPDGIDLFNVGDCRTYRLVGDYLGQLSVDDRVPAPHDAERMLVSQSLGVRKAARLDVHHYRLNPGEPTCLLLCSDGLHDVVSPADLADAFVSESADGRDVVQRLVRKALDAGAPDNVSVLLLEIS